MNTANARRELACYNRKKYGYFVKHYAELLSAVPHAYDPNRYNRSVPRELLSTILNEHSDIVKGTITGLILGGVIGIFAGTGIAIGLLFVTSTMDYIMVASVAIIGLVICIFALIKFSDKNAVTLMKTLVGEIVCVTIMIMSIPIGTAMVNPIIFNRRYVALRAIMNPVAVFVVVATVGSIVGYIRVIMREIYYKYGPAMSTNFGALNGATTKDIFTAVDTDGKDKYLIIDMMDVSPGSINPSNFTVDCAGKLNKYAKSKVSFECTYQMNMLLAMIESSIERFEIINVKMFEAHCGAHPCVGGIGAAIEKLRMIAIPKSELKNSLDHIHKLVKYPNFQDNVALLADHMQYAAIWKVWLLDQS